jgi:hypothetical protein
MSRKMDQSKVFDFLNDVYEASFKTEKLPVSAFIRRHKLGTYVLPVLIEAKILKKVQKGTYKWESIKPNLKMVEKVIEKTSEKNKKAQEKYFSQLEAFDFQSNPVEQLENNEDVKYSVMPAQDLFSQEIVKEEETLTQIKEVEQDTQKLEPKSKYARQRKIEKQKSFSLLWGVITLKW